MPRIRGLVFDPDGTLLEARGGGESVLADPVPSADAAAVLARCFGRYRLALVLATQTSGAVELRATLAGLDWHGYFEALATSADLGQEQVVTGVVRAAASAMGIQPGEVAVVTARTDVAHAANGAGCWSVRITDGGATPDVADLLRDDRPVTTVPSLADVPAALQALVTA